MARVRSLFPAVVKFALGIEVDGPGTIGATVVAGAIKLGGVYLLSGAGVPTGDPGAMAVYLRSDAVSVSTLIYCRQTGSTWAPITVP